MKTMQHINFVSSTNDHLKEQVKKSNLLEGFTVYTDFQTTGKGQSGNMWESEKGKNLLFSIVIYPKKIEIEKQFLISKMVSVAVQQALEEYVEGIKIKWPNDIYYQNKKLGGILIESSLQSNHIRYTIIGVGLNINQTRFNPLLPNPVSLKMITGKSYRRIMLLKKIRQHFFTLYNDSDNETINRIYFENLYRSVGYHNYRIGLGPIFAAKILKVHESGELTLEKANGEILNFYFKEVEFVH
ncbi:MAG: biotin--[acetyl-CoA-carboxylase] ligase [Paludibacteraceae bacterium]